jgi:hypothetical protein
MERIKIQMNSLAQNFAVLLVVGGCVAYVVYQLAQAFRGRKSKLGSCCAKGCSVAEKAVNAPAKPAPAQFLPLGNVGVRMTKKSTA